MAFIGKSPQAGNFIVLDSITTSATATYNLTRNSTAYFPASARNLIVSLNGITQAPDTAYSVSGSTITFSSALTSSDVIDYILVLGDVLSIGTPADNTVGGAQLSYPLTNFSSTGIDDNATSTAITIDSSQDTTFAGKVKLSNGASFGLGGQTQHTDFLGGSSDGTTDDGAFAFYAGRTFNAGAGVVLTGDDHVTPNIVKFVNGAFSEKMRIDANGNLGIGESAPSAKLHVKGDDGLKFVIDSIYAANETLSFTSDNNDFYILNNLTGATSGAEGIGFNSANSKMFFKADGGTRMTIDGTGNVGIGASSPAYRLDIYDTSNPAQMRLRYFQNTNGFFFKNSLNNEAQLVNADNGPMVFKTNDTERVRILSSGGITFNGDTAAANTLDDYEEGTWTPTLTYAGGNTGQVMASGDTEGTYVKIGKLVTVNCRWAQTTKGSSTGVVRISLPLAVSDDLVSTSIEASGAMAYYTDITVSHTHLAPAAWGGTSYVRFYYRASDTNTGMTALSDNHVGNTFDGRFTITYRTT